MGLNKPVVFTEDIQPYNGSSKSKSYSNIIELVHFFRNASCHNDSITLRETLDRKQRIAFVYQFGKRPKN